MVFLLEKLHLRYKYKSDVRYVMLCAIWYHLYNSKKREKIHGGMLLLVMLLMLLLRKVTPPWVFFTFLNCTNGTKLCNASHINVNI